MLYLKNLTKGISFKNIVYFIFGAVILSIYWKGCRSCPEIGKEKVVTQIVYKEGEVKTVVDSVWYKKYHQLLSLVPVEKKIIKTNNVNNNKKKNLNVKISKSEGRIRLFETLINDSTDNLIITGKISSLVSGKLISTDFNYETKSLVIENISNRTDTIFKTVNTEKNVLKNNLWLGAGTSVHPLGRQLSLYLDFTHKKGYSVGYQLQKDFQGVYSHNIRLAKRIF